MTSDIIIVRLSKPIDCAVFQYLLQFSPPEKQQRILRQRVKQNADAMVVGGALARCMLWKTFHIPHTAPVAYGKFGKPYLPDYPNAHFNISHSGAFVACAVCDMPVGIDIQEIVPYQSEIATRICSKAELSSICANPKPNRQFTRIWSKKESFIKLMGSGISEGMAELQYPTSLQFQEHEFENYVVSVYVCQQPERNTI